MYTVGDKVLLEAAFCRQINLVYLSLLHNERPSDRL